jgi:hypothetical protein
MTIRFVNTPTQKIYGDVALELPLIKMSEGEATWLGNEPQIYDENYPLNYSGLHFDTAWWQDTGVGGSFMGDLPSAGGNVALHPADFMPGGYAYNNGMGSLGLTAAQQAAQAARQAAAAAKQQQAQAAAAARQQAAQAAAAQRQAAQAATQAAAQARQQAAQTAAQQRQADAQAKKQAAADAAAAKRAAAQQAAQEKKDAAQAKQQANKDAAALKKAQAACTRQKGSTWDSTNNVCVTGQQACTNSGGTWNGMVCVPAGGTPNPGQQQCQTSGGTWDAVAQYCTPATTTGPITPGAACPQWALPQCPPGQQNGVDSNGCPTQNCVPIPGYQQPPFAQPYPQQPPTNSGPPQTSPIPPGFDSGGGGGGGGGMTPSVGSGMPQQQQQGGGFQMTQDPYGQGGQFDDQANQFQMALPSDTTADMIATEGPEASDANNPNAPKDDASGVANSNIFESISKMFSGGMHGLNCGLGAPPPWIGQGGSNLPQFALRTTTPPIESSTVAGTLGLSVLLVLGSAAVFLWATGKKK